MKISLVTVAYNAQDTIAQCIESVISQKYKNVEYIIIDGGSTDNTLQVIEKYRPHISILVSEPDNGIYDAMNKGIKLASGNIVGMLNADDSLAGDDTLLMIADAFLNKEVDAIYGDLDFLNAEGRIIRKWRSAQCRINSFNRGFMPPHPTFYCKRKLFEQLGFYSLEYGSAADYELMVRFMHAQRIKSFYINKVLVKMRAGGVSNSGLSNRIRAWQYDLKAMRKNGISIPLVTLLLKPLKKIYQFF